MTLHSLPVKHTQMNRNGYKRRAGTMAVKMREWRKKLKKLEDREKNESVIRSAGNERVRLMSTRPEIRTREADTRASRDAASSLLASKTSHLSFF